MTKQAPTNANSLFLVCEGVRPEAGNKLTLVGFYAGDRIVVPIGTERVLLNSLAFLLIFRDGQGTFKTGVSLRSPSGKELFEDSPIRDVELKENSTHTFAFQIVPFQSEEFGASSFGSVSR